MANQGLLCYERAFNYEVTDPKPLQLDELQTLLYMAESFGKTVDAARNMKSGYDAVLSDVYAVGYAIENEIIVFVDNFTELIRFTGWERGRSPKTATAIGKVA